MLTDVVPVSVSEHRSDVSNTFHARVQATFDIAADLSQGSRVDKVANALFYTYVWGWYTGFIEMPHYSIQGLLSSPPAGVAYNPADVALGVQENQEALHRYRFLSSLFADESDPRFESKNFGFLTPFEAQDEYTHFYDARFNGYFGRALGGVLELLPGLHQ
ncbi:MAG: hypothetical protein OXI43_13205 [Candidatus Poribacteria bacterium]|nr:hypothetical protein [Candidatus Poribacteria bacterium]